MLKRSCGPGRRAALRGVLAVCVRVYFDVSYGLLARSAAGRRLLALEAAGGGPVHGYFTSEDRDVLLAALDPRPGDRILDLGCGVGGIAFEVHRRSGAEILGVDISPAAISAARERARHEGLDARVTFRTGDLARPPDVGARKAYAIDSLMFVPDLTSAVRGIGDVLGSGGLLFATLVVVSAGAEEQLGRSVRTAGASIERLQEVTPALVERSRARANASRALRLRATSLRGRLAMWLVAAEEASMRALIAARRVSRWRFVVRYGPMPDRGPSPGPPGGPPASDATSDTVGNS